MDPLIRTLKYGMAIERKNTSLDEFLKELPNFDMYSMLGQEQEAFQPNFAMPMTWEENSFQQGGAYWVEIENDPLVNPEQIKDDIANLAMVFGMDGDIRVKSYGNAINGQWIPEFYILKKDGKQIQVKGYNVPDIQYVIGALGSLMTFDDGASMPERDNKLSNVALWFNHYDPENVRIDPVDQDSGLMALEISLKPDELEYLLELRKGQERIEWDFDYKMGGPVEQGLDVHNSKIIVDEGGLKTIIKARPTTGAVKQYKVFLTPEHAIAMSKGDASFAKDLILYNNAKQHKL